MGMAYDNAVRNDELTSRRAVEGHHLLHGVETRPLGRALDRRHGCAYREKLDRVGTPPPVGLFYPRPDDADATAGHRFGLHPFERQLTRRVGGLGVDLHLLVSTDLLERLHETQVCDVVDARAHRQADRAIAAAHEFP